MSTADAGLLSPPPLASPCPARPSGPNRFGAAPARAVSSCPFAPPVARAPCRAFAVCPQCTATTLAWEQSAGRGTLYSWTVVWRPPHPGFVVPYAPAVVALDEGWWFLSAVVGCAPEVLREGLAVGVEFHPASDELALPYFRPIA